MSLVAMNEQNGMELCNAKASATACNSAGACCTWKNGENEEANENDHLGCDYAGADGVECDHP